jgi:hypothetical protein
MIMFAWLDLEVADRFHEGRLTALTGDGVRREGVRSHAGLVERRLHCGWAESGGGY